MDSTKKIWKIDQKSSKNAQQGPPKRIFEFYPLFSHPEPWKTWKPQHSEGFSKRSAAPARPRVAKAMRLARPPNGEASPDLYNKGLRPLPPTPGHWRLMAKSNPGKETMPDAHAAGKAGTRRHRYTNNTASLQLAGVLLQLACVLYSQRSTVPNVAFWSD